MAKLRKYINIYILVTLISAPLCVHAAYTCMHAENVESCIHCDDDHKNSEIAFSFNFHENSGECCDVEIDFYSDFIDVLPVISVSSLDPPNSILVISDLEADRLTFLQRNKLKSYSPHKTKLISIATYLATLRIRI